MNFKNEITINGKIISKNHKPLLVAEIGLNHNNDLEIGKRTISAAKKAGVDAVKFQSYITEEFIDPRSSDAKFLFDIFKQYELSEQSHREFQKTAENEGLIFFSTPLCVSSVDLLIKLKVPVLKIASGDIVNSELLEKCASSGLPMFVSTGAADLHEVTRAIEFLDSQKVSELCLMHCVSLYPTPPENLNLKTIQLFSSMYDFPIGFSDHSAGALGAAVAIGYDACVIEKHFTLDKTLPGPDHTISVDPIEMKILADNCELAFKMKGDKIKKVTESEFNGRFFGRRSLYLNEKKTQPIAMRPALHVKDPSVQEAWRHLDFKVRDLNKLKPGEPIRLDI
ncbi:MAG: N-acetylneuraminate synthase family protein [Leptospiraceae bacterium]|nr:N-acetylneuraminate synthase family protein [Leptospiraceae bacterium]